MSVKGMRKKSGKENKPGMKSGDTENELENLRQRLEVRSQAFEKIIRQLNKSGNKLKH